MHRIEISYDANLDFKIAAWNRKSTADVDEMLDEIVKRQKQYKELSEMAKDHCKDFSTRMADNFIWETSRAKCDGTHKAAENASKYRALKNSLFGPLDDPGWSELRETGLLTVPVVCDLHTTLLRGLKSSSDGGKIREKGGGRGKVLTEYNGIHIYPDAELVEDAFYCIIDQHNIHMKNWEKDGISLEQTVYIFKCAAWLFLKLILLHPFFEGNGRLCHLLANYVLSLITPFPVPIYDASSSDRNRGNYLHAVHGTGNEKQGMAELASMLVEGAYLGWKDLFQYLESS